MLVSNQALQQCKIIVTNRKGSEQKWPKEHSFDME